MPAYVEPSAQLMMEVVRAQPAGLQRLRRLGFTVVRQEEQFMALRWDSGPFALKELPEAPPPLQHPVATLRIMVPDVEAYWQMIQQMDVPVLWPL